MSIISQEEPFIDKHAGGTAFSEYVRRQICENRQTLDSDRPTLADRRSKAA